MGHADKVFGCVRANKKKPLQARQITVPAHAAASFARPCPAARAHADRPTPLLLPLLPMKLMEDLTFANTDEVYGGLDIRDILRENNRLPLFHLALSLGEEDGGYPRSPRSYR